MNRPKESGQCPMLRPLFALLAFAWVGCVNIYPTDRALLLDQSHGQIDVLASCQGTSRSVPNAADSALDPDSISLITWNVHKNADAGWDSDLSLFAARHDLVFLQEAHIEPALTNILEAAGHHWMLATAFGLGGRDTGVMTASAVVPSSACVLRQMEPFLRLPKSAIVSVYRLQGRDDTLAVANIHSINFALAGGAYRAQLEAIITHLVGHQGPIVFAGDLNTWTAGRRALLESLAGRLGLTEVRLDRDTRRRFLGKQVDHVFVRGLEVLGAHVIEVDSSDHNPVSTVLRVP